MSYEIKQYWQLSDKDIDALYDSAVAEKVLEMVAYDMPVNRELFHLFAKRAEVFAAVYDGATHQAFFYLSHFEGSVARLHFCFFKTGRPDRHEIGRLVLNWCFDSFDFKCLISVPPATNFGAVKYAREMGGREVGKLPGFCWIEKLKRVVDGIMFIFERTGKWAA